MTHRQPSRETITQRTLAMPHVDGDTVLEENQALAFWEDIRRNNPGLYSHLSSQIDRLDETIGHQVGETIDPKIRRGIIARVAIASAAQVISDTGQSIIDIRALSSLFSADIAEQPDDPAA